MLFLFMLVNFADKAIIGLAAVPIIRDLHLTNEQFGKVGSAFFLLFSISAVAVGFVVNRVSTKLVLIIMALIWAAAQLPMLGTVTLPILIASRVVLGAGEGPAYPVALHAAYKWFPNEHRTLPTSVIALGAAVGAGFVAPLLVWIIAAYGWHTAFLTLGGAGFVWVVIWTFLGKEGPLDLERPEGGGNGLVHLPYATLLTSRTFVGAFIAAFSAYWVLALGVVWMPAFLARVGGFSAAQIGWIAVLPSFLQIFLGPACGFISQRMRTRGASSRASRGLLGGGGVVLSGVALVLLSRASSPYLQIPLAMLTFAIGSVIFTLGPPLVGEISPVHQRGATLGIYNALYTMAGLLAPWLMGHIVDAGANPAEGFRNGFMLAGVVVGVGGLLAMLLINPERDLARFKQAPTSSVRSRGR
ncbi:MAG: MFS transporter [Acidovorax sp.]